MKTFKIEGGHQLKGEIQPQGAKNEALQILCAILLTPEKVTIHNIPDIVDVNKLIALLGKLGVKVNRIKPNSYQFQADEVNMEYLESDEFNITERQHGRLFLPVCFLRALLCLLQVIQSIG